MMSYKVKEKDDGRMKVSFFVKEVPSKSHSIPCTGCVGDIDDALCVALPDCPGKIFVKADQ